MKKAVLSAWREVRWIIVGLGGLLLLAMGFKRRWLALLPAGLLGWVFYFFRDPERQPDSSSARAILSPADGKVMDVEVVDEPLWFHGPAQRIRIFLSLMDVHVQRSPFSGVVGLVQYHPGEFLPAFLKDSQRNEANFIGLKTRHGPLAVKQIAGILARRIVCWSACGDDVAIGSHLGLIRFGSRVDLFLPLDVKVAVEVGQQVYGGKTAVAWWHNT